jgi:hypothetical protein
MSASRSPSEDTGSTELAALLRRIEELEASVAESSIRIDSVESALPVVREHAVDLAERSLIEHAEGAWAALRTQGQRLDELVGEIAYAVEGAAALVADPPPELPPEGERLRLSSASGGQSRVLCSFATGAYRELLRLCLPGLLAYGQRWSWDVVVSCEGQLAAGRAASWAKVPLLQSLLETYELVFFVDADAGFVDTGADVLAELEPGRLLWLAPTYDDPAGLVNAGVLVARRDAWTSELLAALWSDEATIDHPWWENAAILRALGFDLGTGARRPSEAWDHVGLLPRRWNVRVDCPLPDAVIRHHTADRPVPLVERRLRLLADVGRLVSRR